MAQKLTWLLVAGMLIAGPVQRASCQTSSLQPSATSPDKAVQQTPTYEVATIKPPGPNEYASPLRVYIQSAYGIPANSVGWVIGPGWINSTRYVIEAKPTDSMQKAMQTMPAEEKRKQVHRMMQGLLADRFNLKAHFETREMPVYELLIAKDGPKLKENPDSSHGLVGFSPSLIKGKATSIQHLIEALESVPDIGGRVVVDKTGLSGSYDLLLKWTPLQASSPSGRLSSNAPSPDAEAASLFTAIDEQLGLKLVASKEPGQVLVIDHIERPSAN
jgi:bla regulator protein BlaR1